MGLRFAAFLSAALMASAAVAQSVPASASTSDSWAKPATATRAVTYRSDAVPDATASSQTSKFKFKSENRHRLLYQPPPSATDQAAVLGLERPWQNGRPPVDCAITPHDSACRH